MQLFLAREQTLNPTHSRLDIVLVCKQEAVQGVPLANVF